MSTEATPQPPQIPDYELLRLIGRGAYGEVWLARGVTGIYRAVKLVWRDRFPDAGPYEREFHGLREFAAISLSESRQLALLHVGRDPAAAYFYYVMELADDAVTGREIDPANYTPLTLKEMRLRQGRLPAGECIALGAELARALSSLHARGLVHRDIKPSNVILVGGAPKLADIGLVTEASAALTFVGTEGFVPPEGPGAPSADVFALGKLLYELATGLDRHDYPRLPPELHSWPDRKEVLELNEVLIRACEPHPDRRHPDAAALLDDLLLLQAGRSVRQLRRAQRQVTRALRLGVLLALIAAIAGLGAYLERQRANQEMSGRLAAEAERDALARQAMYSAALAQAERALDQDDLARARRLLDAVNPHPGEVDLRGFEWHVLRTRAQGDPATILRDSGPAIDRCALSPDESQLAVHDAADAVTLYDTTTQEHMRRLEGIRGLAGFSADGRWLVGTASTLSLARWPVAGGAPVGAELSGKFRALAAWGPDQVVAYDDSKESLLVWDFATRQAISVTPLPTDKKAPWALFRSGASPTGGTVVLASVRGGGSLAEFRLTAFAPAAASSAITTSIGRNRPSAVGADSHGPWAVFDVSGEVWRVRDGQWSKTPDTLPAGTRKILEFTQGGFNRQVLAQGRRLIWLDPAPSYPASRIARGHGALVSDAVIAARRNIVYSASSDGGLRAWPLEGASRADRLAAWNNNAGATGVVFSADSRQVCVPVDGNSSRWFDVATLQPTGAAVGFQFPVALTSTGLLGVVPGAGLAVVAADGTIRPAGSRSAVAVRVVAVSADGRQTAELDQGNELRADGPVVRSGLQRYFCMQLDATGQRLWLTATTRELICLSWPDGRELWRQLLPAIAPYFMLLPDQRRLVLALENGSLEIRDTATGAVMRQLDSGSGAPQGLALSPDGSRLFVAGIEGDVHCFTTEDWRYLHALPLGENQRLHVLACAPDGRTLVALTKTGVLHVMRTQ